jgi:hypothetical protein
MDQELDYTLCGMECNGVDVNNNSNEHKQSKRSAGKGNDRISYPPGMRASTGVNEMGIKV